ncbi:hypothetical protein [Actinoplanes siamensis]|uniref:Uncharacterized protein n=1 Tax=Actinoplanes siamensis TaxID=1223317 RepID=A0A919TIG8_9ACTN|nr:hypothetical protein [Actinoplanes siamensis]GIF04476.1 hypothetical protein Asi03nite_20140 [Actinoplanes siamensis]
MTYPLARTRQEAHLHIDLTPCECGDRRLVTAGEAVTLPDGTPGRRYAGRCPGCGRDRLFVFRVPEVPEDSAGAREIVYGRGTRPSELLDPGQWLWAAEQYADAVPANPGHLAGEPRATARTWLMAAVAALREAVKFIPDGADRVPAEAFRSAPGRDRYVREPAAFTRQRLVDLRLGVERRLRALRDAPAAPDPDAVRRQAAESRAVEAWARRHGLERAALGAGTAEQNREIERELRALNGQDPETGLGRAGPRGGFAAFRQLISGLEAELAGDVPQRDLRIGLALAAYQAWLERHRIDDTAWRDRLWTGSVVWDLTDADLPPAGAVWEMVAAARAAARRQL